MATPTPIPADQSLRSGAAAAIATWSGAAIAAQPFTHRSRDRTAESATEALCRCLRTSSAVDLTHYAAILARIAAEHPTCRMCGKACVAGQTNAHGKPAHFACQRLGYNPFK